MTLALPAPERLAGYPLNDAVEGPLGPHLSATKQTSQALGDSYNVSTLTFGQTYHLGLFCFPSNGDDC